MPDLKHDVELGRRALDRGGQDLLGGDGHEPITFSEDPNEVASPPHAVSSPGSAWQFSSSGAERGSVCYCPFSIDHPSIRLFSINTIRNGNIVFVVGVVDYCRGRERCGRADATKEGWPNDQ